MLPAAPDMRALASKHGVIEKDVSGVGLNAQTLAIINTANRPWSVIDSEQLVREWSAFKTIEFYYSASGRSFDCTDTVLDRKITIADDTDALLCRLHELTPAVIYLRVSPHTRSEYLVTLIRLQFPDACLLVEFYDMSCMFDRQALGYIFSGDERRIEAAMEGCAVALHHSDGLLMKMGGKAFGVSTADIKVPIFTFFPLIDACETERSQGSSTMRKILYAGSVSARELTTGIGSVDGANLIRYFDIFQDHADCTLDIVNGVHTSADEDASPKFSALLERYENVGQITYHRAMPRQQLLVMAANYDIGICCAHYADDRVMDVTRFGLPNRVVTYIDAGLPVLIDDRFDYAAELIRSFDAGRVIPAGDFDGLKKAASELDIGAARSGVASLKRHMLQENQKKFSDLHCLVEKKIVIP